MYIIYCYILFLLLKIVSLEAFSTWGMGFGSKSIMEEMYKRAKESNFTYYDIHDKSNGIYVKGTAKLIQQRLDNFNPQEKRTWNMRYLEYLGHFKPNGPIYLLIAGEGPIYDSFAGSSVNELAHETNGAMFMPEHRYYGQSMPLNISDPKNLRYLSSKQALADFAHLIVTIKSQPGFKNSKVVAVGGSYAGNLATWMRAKYPQLVNCAWASSAPVLAKTNFLEYLEQVGADFMKYGGEQCYDKIAYKFGRYHKLLQTTQGIEQLKKERNICPQTDMTKPLNKAGFMSDMVIHFMLIAQNGSPAGIKNMCGKIMVEKDYSFSLRNEFETKNRCTDYEFNKNFKSYYSSWVYQTCAEFGYYVTTDSRNQPFSNEIILDYNTQICFKLFSLSDVDKAVANTNNFYGGLKPDVTKVIFVHGSLDPWHRLGITKSLSDDVLATMIEGTSHCRDFFSYEPSEPPQLTVAREYAKKLIKSWLRL